MIEGLALAKQRAGCIPFFAGQDVAGIEAVVWFGEKVSKIHGDAALVFQGAFMAYLAC